MSRADRNTICVENAEILRRDVHPDGQHVIRLKAPECAALAVAGSFIHIRCNEDLPMRRPLSIMRARANEGWIEVLFKVIGAGLERLADAQVGDRLSIMGPIGNGFTPDEQRTTPLLIGGGVGIPPLIFLAEQLAATHPGFRPIAFFGSEIPFPFALTNSALALEPIPASVDQTLTEVEALGVACRLATNAGLAGCYDGFVTDLARDWLGSLTAEQLATVQVYACGPEPMLHAVARVTSEFSLPSLLCLEEYMACAVGGCAGCAVEIQTPDGPAMKRVCVDGPVFAGDTVYPSAP